MNVEEHQAAVKRDKQVIKYLKDWNDGFAFVGREWEDIPRRISANVMAYFNVPDTLTMAPLYRRSVIQLFATGTLELYLFEGSYYVSLAHLGPIEHMELVQYVWA
jgi:hypothetical protein